nr:V-type immunoglobulin domain-containing suppressor of T-cell activation [Monopterus albus]XP_020454604.1 V-type immunoglobulin domain-containing suppressor of T-cell activation [Monopterus albus]
MKGGLLYRTSVWEKKCVFWICSVLFSIAGATGEMSHGHSTISVSAPHLYYSCPEGATVRMMCTQSGAALHSSDIVKRIWLFTPHSDKHCVRHQGPRNTNIIHHSHANHSFPPGMHYERKGQNFWVVLENVTGADQGRYCCEILDVQVENKHPSIVDKTHSHVILQITPRRNGSQDCTVWDPAPSGSAPVALAVAACILALLFLPLILVLVYKQRQSAQTNRRAQELVRMDSGHENPVFLGGSPQTKTRTVSQIMTRQASETGRHLLSEPGTPLSPPAYVFFPVEDVIPESPDLQQV